MPFVSRWLSVLIPLDLTNYRKEARADEKFLKELELIREEGSEAEIKKLRPFKGGVCGEFNEPFTGDTCWKCKTSLDPLRLMKEFYGAEVIEAVIDNDLEKKILDVLRAEGKVRI